MSNEPKATQDAQPAPKKAPAGVTKTTKDQPEPQQEAQHSFQDWASI